MGIRWDRIHIGASALGNKIYLFKESPKNPNLMLDKSDDRTQECVIAVMTMLDSEMKSKGLDHVSYECNAGVLTWTKKEGK